MRGMGLRWMWRAERGRMLARTSGLSWTAKSRGPGAPTLALSLMSVLSASHEVTGARQPGPRGDRV
ncbi:protein of unknown function [Bradyrhizobium sp. ORS 285]|nr:protein of unknown function [Bradyrhizobium sp. ORS 285]